MDGNFSTGDIIINRCMLDTDPERSTSSQGENQSKSVDISRHVDNFKIYHSIMKPYAALVMLLVDSTDILNNNLGLTGNNIINLSFNQPGQKPYEGKFRITSVESTRSTENQRTKIYKIIGYSKHMSNLPVVEKAYKNQTPTDTAKDLIQTFMKPEKELDIRAPSKGTIGNEKIPFTVNGIQIHKAVRSVLLRAASSMQNDESSAYMFFENSEKLVIDTLENMINTARQKQIQKGDDLYFTRRPMGQDFVRDQRDEQTNILAVKENTRVDSTRTAQSLQQATNVFDLFSGEFKSTKNQFDKDGKKTEGGTPTVNNNIPYNLLRPPTFAQDYMPSRKYIASVADSQDLTIHVPFNSSVEIGQGFRVDLYAPLGDTETNATDTVVDSVKGVLLAIELCHTVSLRAKKCQGTTTVRGIAGPPPKK